MTRLLPPGGSGVSRDRPTFSPLPLIALGILFAPLLLEAHDVARRDSAFLVSNTGTALIPYFYLGAKHMVTGIDHLLYLAGVIFFVHRLREVAVYVTLFALGHSTTLLLGVLGGIHANASLVDAIIGLSVVYKAYENMGGFVRLGVQPDPRVAVTVFGLFHGFGLATKLQSYALSSDGLVLNILAFNVGVEAGQLLALAGMLSVFVLWRRSGGFERHAFAANWVLMTAGFVLAGIHFKEYLTT